MEKTKVVSEKVKLGREIAEVTYQKIKNQLWVHIQGETHVFELSQGRKGSKNKASVAQTGEVLATMPGKIIKIHVSKDQEVKAGDDMVSMEAMKMEYVLKADVDGTVSQLNCNEGEQVQVGQLLVFIKKGEGVE